MRYRCYAGVPMSTIGPLSLGAAWLALLALTGCDRSIATGPPDAVGLPLRGLAIGDPCEPADGWQPAPVVPDGTSSPSETPVGVVPPADYVDRTDLPPGAGFCLTGVLYPSGYFTTNCSEDADCPGGARCSGAGVAGGQCRIPCTRNSECAPPSTCERGGLVFSCQCLSCIADWVRENGP
jgi:hypothetical protein